MKLARWMLRQFVILALLYLMVTAQCNDPAPAPNTYRSFPNDTVVEYSCVDNYFLVSGNLTRICENGIYTGDSPVCKLSCGAPYNYSSSAVAMYSNTESGSVLTYNCTGDDDVVSSSITSCSAYDGAWQTADTCYRNASINRTEFIAWQSSTAKYTDVLLTPTTFTDNSTDASDLLKFGANNVLGSTASLSLLNGGCSSTASEQNPELIIQMTPHSYTIYGVAVTVPVDEFAFSLPNIFVGYKSQLNYKWNTCKRQTTPISRGSRVILQCPLLRYSPAGKYILISTDYGSAFGMLQICDVEILAQLTEKVDCGQPMEWPFSRIVEAPTTTTLQSTVYYTCIDGFHNKNGRMYSLCLNSGHWSKSVNCVNDINFGLNTTIQSTLNDTSVLTDGNVTSCLVLEADTDGSFVLDLETDVEVSDVTVRFEDLHVSSISPKLTLTVWRNGSREFVCGSTTVRQQYYNVGNIACEFHPVVHYVKVEISAPFIGLTVCDVFVHGRHFNEALECQDMIKSVAYKGLMNVTVMGISCQRWDSQTPHAHTDTDVSKFPDDTLNDAANYCRNPSNNKRISVWCYTTDPDIEWQYCPVRECDYVCLRDSNGKRYQGNMKTTASGKSCEDWDITPIQRMTHRNHNLPRCSNPLQSQSTPWCYTASEASEYEHCVLPTCPTRSELTWVFLELGVRTDMADLSPSMGECHVWRNFFDKYGNISGSSNSARNPIRDTQLIKRNVCATGKTFNMTFLCWDYTDTGFVWKTGIMECVHCDSIIPSVDNATVSSSSTRQYAVATYSCVSGYGHASGSKTITCLKNGQWETPTMTCLLDCGSPPPVLGATLEFNGTLVGDVTNYTCMDNYVYMSGSSQINCDEDGKWGQPDIYCLAKCGEPPSIGNTSMSKSGIVLNDTAVYTCISGYVHVSGQSTIACQDTAQWSEPDIVCAVDCGTPPDVLNATTSVSTTYLNSTATYTCIAGLTRVKGTGNAKCLETGKWEDPDTLCEVDCHSPPSIQNTNVTVNNTWINNTAEYTCIHGYAHVSGTTLVTCHGNGSWGNPDIVCLIVAVTSTSDQFTLIESVSTLEESVSTLEESVSTLEESVSTLDWYSLTSGDWNSLDPTTRESSSLYNVMPSTTQPQTTYTDTNAFTMTSVDSSLYINSYTDQTSTYSHVLTDAINPSLSDTSTLLYEPTSLTALSSTSKSNSTSTTPQTTTPSGGLGIIIDRWGRIRREMCFCRCAKKVENKTQEEVVDEIKKDLLLDRKTLTAYIMTKESSKDDRPSTSGMGYVAMIVFGVIFGVVFVSDVATCIKGAAEKLKVRSL